MADTEPKRIATKYGIGTIEQQDYATAAQRATDKTEKDFYTALNNDEKFQTAFHNGVSALSYSLSGPRAEMIGEEPRLHSGGLTALGREPGARNAISDAVIRGMKAGKTVEELTEILETNAAVEQRAGEITRGITADLNLYDKAHTNKDGHIDYEAPERREYLKKIITAAEEKLEEIGKYTKSYNNAKTENKISSLGGDMENALKIAAQSGVVGHSFPVELNAEQHIGKANTGSLAFSTQNYLG